MTHLPVVVAHAMHTCLSRCTTQPPVEKAVRIVPRPSVWVGSAVLPTRPMGNAHRHFLTVPFCPRDIDMLATANEALLHLELQLRRYGIRLTSSSAKRSTMSTKNDYTAAHLQRRREMDRLPLDRADESRACVLMDI